ncbi:MAG: tRNA pseudouridine(38-40) synthase TruA [Candidatus Heimdallarchaeota archaeon]|nr:tRNA pseudouridine(38-40) synthase TruA [Candidatus Heimdallarchaeota archaeon]MCK4254659.1 tRNA pseudouridine(38-40) synthase TruA [Candidatus Heimdallarchaeota archaeon]
MIRYIVQVYYEGKNYFGYQRQPNISTVEETLLQALIETNHIISAQNNWFISASRTDKNVNAIGNVIGFNSEKEIIIEQINAQLPKDNSIVCWSHAKVKEDFSPKHSLKKKYWYLAEKGNLEDEVEKEISKMQKICSLFEGKNDYRLFCKNDLRNTSREIERINIMEEQGYILFEFVAQSFLWEQIRRIVGYIMNYSKLSVELKNTKALLRTRTDIDSLNIQPADPNNLILVKQYYKDVKWIVNGKALKIIREKISGVLRKIKQEEVQKGLILGYIKDLYI